MNFKQSKILKFSMAVLSFLAFIVSNLPVQAIRINDLLQFPDKMPWFGPVVLGPEIQVTTERQQSGTSVTINGKNFTKGGAVEIFFEDLMGRPAPLSAGDIIASQLGTFTLVYNAKCWPSQFAPVTVRAVDKETGTSKTSKTLAFSC